MATTYEEISNSHRLNRSFWNGEVRFNILLIREADSGRGAYPESPRHLRESLRRKLQQRARFEYLNPAAS